MTDPNDMMMDGMMPGMPMPEDGKFRAGEPLEEGQEPTSEEMIVDMIRTCYDPEISVNIYDLGLIYNIEIMENGDVKIDMTLTSPMCPVAGSLPMEVAQKVAQLPGVGEVEVQLVWDPPWDMDKMTDEAKLALDWF